MVYESSGAQNLILHNKMKHGWFASCHNRLVRPESKSNLQIQIIGFRMCNLTLLLSLPTCLFHHVSMGCWGCWSLVKEARQQDSGQLHHTVNIVKQFIFGCLPKTLHTYNNLNIFMYIFARGTELLCCCILKIPQFVLHSIVKLLRILFSFVVKLATNRCILCWKKKW